MFKKKKKKKKNIYLEKLKKPSSLALRVFWYLCVSDKVSRALKVQQHFLENEKREIQDSLPPSKK